MRQHLDAMPQTDREAAPADPTEDRPFRLDAWLVQPGNGEIGNAETVVRIGPKAMDVLVYLAEHAGEVVSREDLERHIWRGALVGYDAVTSTVIKLRMALDDDARDPRYIATVPTRGYRLQWTCARTQPMSESCLRLGVVRPS